MESLKVKISKEDDSDFYIINPHIIFPKMSLTDIKKELAKDGRSDVLSAENIARDVKSLSLRLKARTIMPKEGYPDADDILTKIADVFVREDEYDLYDLLMKAKEENEALRRANDILLQKLENICKTSG